MPLSHYLLLGAILILAIVLAGWIIGIMFDGMDDLGQQSKQKNDELIRESKWAEFNAKR